MEILGRYLMLRPFWVHTQTLGEPLLIDRLFGSMRPYLGTSEAREEWEPRFERNEALDKWRKFKSKVDNEREFANKQRLADRLQRRHADFAQIAAVAFGQDDFYCRVLFRDATLGAAANINLNNNYVSGTSGNAIGVRYQAIASKTINNVYFYIASYTGTAANVNDINLELRPEASTGAVLPNTASLTESKTYNPSSATGWQNVSGWTSVLSALSRNFFIVGDADGGATDFAAVTRSLASMFENTGQLSFASRYLTVSTTGGFASGNTATPTPSAIVLLFSDSTAYGNPLTTSTTPSSSSQQRGLKISSTALTNAIKVFGMTWTSASANISGIKIFSGSTAPNGTADNTSTDLLYGITAAARNGCLTSSGTSFKFSTGTQYRMVTTYSAATSGGPIRCDVGTGEDANLRAAMPGDGQWTWTQDDGASAWSNDLAGSIPAIGLLVDGQTAAAASGGGGHIIGSF